jgi:hypothetical protein
MFRLTIAFAIFLFWVLGLRMVVHPAADTLFDQASQLKVVKTGSREK